MTQMNDFDLEMQDEGRDSEEADNAETVQSTYEGFRGLGRPHKLALEDTNETLSIDNADFYISTHTIPFTDESTTYFANQWPSGMVKTPNWKPGDAWTTYKERMISWRLSNDYPTK